MGEAKGTHKSYPSGQSAAFRGRVKTEIDWMLGFAGDPDADETIGWETEFTLVCPAGLPLRAAQYVVRRVHGLVHELMLHQGEACGEDQVLPFGTTVFDQYQLITSRKLRAAHNAAAEIGGQLCLAGVLPSLTLRDLLPSAVTPGNPRFPALAHHLQNSLGDIHFQMGGIDLTTDMFGIAGIGNAEQAHRTVPLHYLVDLVNASQMAASVIVAATAGSPVVLGERAGAEGRIPALTSAFRHLPTLGPCLQLPDGSAGWVQTPRQVLEYSLGFPVVMPELNDTAVSQAWHWRFLNGLTHPWVCPTFYPSSRRFGIEFRPMPAGPSIIDQAINNAIFHAVTAALMQPIGIWIAAGYDYHHAVSNFYAATEKGLDAEFMWPDSNGRAQCVIARDVALDLLNKDAVLALADLGVGLPAAEAILAPARMRVETKQTAAHWITEAVELNPGVNWDHTLALVTLQYMRLSDNGLTEEHPVHTWPRASAKQLLSC